MSRNREKDESDKARCMLAAMESGFHLFSEKGIEPVKMTDIVEDCGVSRRSLYRYFSTKTDLVIAIGAWKWKGFFDHYTAQVPVGEPDVLTAAERMRWYLDSFVDMYRHHRDILRYNYYFNSFLSNEESAQEQRKPYLDVVNELEKAFHWLYERGQRDGTLRTDIPESVMFSSSFHIMLAAVTRYAVGLVYVKEGNDPEKELWMLEEALLKLYAADR